MPLPRSIDLPGCGRPRRWSRARFGLLLAWPLWWAGAAQAEALPGRALGEALSARYCDPDPDLNAARQDRLLRLSDWLRMQLDGAGASVALVARAGLDLQALGLRLSHAGVALRQGLDSPWAVRQLYYACNEGQPRLFDQGLAGFMAGTPSSRIAQFELLVMPDGPRAEALRQSASSKVTALGLLADTYTANAHAWSTRYQNCNQWLAELLGWAWGPGQAAQLHLGADTRPGPTRALSAADDRLHRVSPAGAAGAPGSAVPGVSDQRAQAQAWLRSAGYQPQAVELGPWRLWLARFWPLVALDDHPAEDLAAHRLQVSMPDALLHFAQGQVPDARRWRVCLTADHAVLREGGPPLDDLCQASADGHDKVLVFALP